MNLILQLTQCSLDLSCFHSCSSAVAVAGDCLLQGGLWASGLVLEGTDLDKQNLFLIVQDPYDDEDLGFCLF